MQKHNELRKKNAKRNNGNNCHCVGELAIVNMRGVGGVGWVCKEAHAKSFYYYY